MSALFGIWHKDGAPLVETSLDAMESALAEWLCDARTVWHGGKIGLGRRLCYTTAESHHETLCTFSGMSELVITADTWLDNRVELCDALAVPHSERASLADSALIGRAYLKWGEGCAAKLRGD